MDRYLTSRQQSTRWFTVLTFRYPSLSSAWAAPISTLWTDLTLTKFLYTLSITGERCQRISSSSCPSDNLRTTRWLLQRRLSRRCQDKCWTTSVGRVLYPIRPQRLKRELFSSNYHELRALVAACHKTSKTSGHRKRKRCSRNYRSAVWTSSKCKTLLTAEAWPASMKTFFIMN